MKRDMDLARKILMKMEEHPEPNGGIILDLEGYSQEEISYHVKLLTEAGLIEGRDIGLFGELTWEPISLTWAGHEFLDAA